MTTSNQRHSPESQASPQSDTIATPRSIDEYISRQREELQALLTLTRQIFREALPEADERISWQMPTFWQGRNIIHFAAMKNHLGIYPGAETVAHFSAELERRGYKYAKGSIQIPYRSPLPHDLLRHLALWAKKVNSK